MLHKTFYNVICPECDTELFEGDYDDCVKYLKRNFQNITDADIEEDEKQIFSLCDRCARLIS